MVPVWRRLLACLLLALLSLQPAAAATLCAHAAAADTSAAQSQAADMPCMHGQSDQAMAPAPAASDAAAPGDLGAHSCCASAVCVMCSIVATSRPLPQGASRHEKLGVSHAARFTSFVPEGLQRPPSPRA